MKSITSIAIAVLAINLACEHKKQEDHSKFIPQQNIPPIPPALPFAFKEFALGMTYADFAKLKPRITYKTTEKHQTSVFFDTTIGGEKAKAYLLFKDFGKGLQLEWINLTINKVDFYLAKDALISKFGAPTNASSISKSNAMGATFNGERLEWDNGTSEITAESIGSKIDESSIDFRHRTLGRAIVDTQKEKAAKSDI